MEVKSKVSATDIHQINELLYPIGSELFTKDSDAVRYAQSTKRWSVAAIKAAGAVLVPENIESVSIVVRYITQHNIDLAVRGGGHSTGGHSSTEGGILIDLGSSNLFTKVEVQLDKEHIIAGGGANWGNVDDAGFAAGLVTVGGTVHDTGIGGLTLGGGYGWLSGKIGLAIDNLISVKLVTADGTVLTASNNDHQELFWALRGAGQNFGIALQFVYQAYPYGMHHPGRSIGGAAGGQAYAGILQYSISSLSEVLQALNTLFGPCGTLKDGTGASGLAIARLQTTNSIDTAPGPLIIVVPVVWHGNEQSGMRAFKSLLDIGPSINGLTMMDYPGINRIFKFEPEMRASMKGYVYNLPFREEFVRELLASYSKFTEEVPDARKSVLHFDLLNQAVVVSKASNNDMAFGNRGHHLNGAAEVFWSLTENDQVCRQWARDISARIKKELEVNVQTNSAGSKNLTENSAVMMYGNLEQYDENARDLFGTNLPRLQKIKARYDPNNTFHKHFNIHQTL